MFNVPLFGLSATTRLESMTLLSLVHMYLRAAAYMILQ